jgi:hypothetical protein
MRFPLARALALLSIGAVLAACTDRPESTPTAPGARVSVPRGATGSALQVAATCDINQLKLDGKAVTAKANDLLQNYITAIGTSLKNDGGLSAGTTDHAYDALSRLGVIRGTKDMKSDVTATTFDHLVRGLLACVQPALLAGVQDPATAHGFGDAVYAGWVFEVRGKTSDPADPTGPAFERVSAGTNTWWVFDKNATSWTNAISTNWVPQRVFVFGYRTSDFLSGYNVFGGSAFEHRTIPKTVKPVGSPPTNNYFTVSAIVGLCWNEFANLTTTGKERVDHNNKFLALTTYSCSTPPAFTASTGSYALGTFSPRLLAQRAAKFFAPQPLYAATFFGGGSVTGSPDDFSPSAVYDLSGLQLGSPGTVANGFTSQALQLTTGGPITLNVTVTGTTPQQPAPDGTPVTVSISGNSSTIAFFADGSATATPSVTVTRYTTGGVVTFDNLYLTKSGGYTLAFQITAPPPATGVGPLVLSNSFQMQNK